MSCNELLIVFRNGDKFPRCTTCVCLFCSHFNYFGRLSVWRIGLCQHFVFSSAWGERRPEDTWTQAPSLPGGHGGTNGHTASKPDGPWGVFAHLFAGGTERPAKIFLDEGKHSRTTMWNTIQLVSLELVSSSDEMGINVHKCSKGFYWYWPLTVSCSIWGKKTKPEF